MRAGYSDTVTPLTPRMVEVLASAARGRTIAETALELGVAPATITNIRAAAFARLGAHNVTGALAIARARAELAA